MTKPILSKLRWLFGVLATLAVVLLPWQAECRAAPGSVPSSVPSNARGNRPPLGKSEASLSRISVLVSVPYIADLVREATCGDASVVVESVVPAGVDPHSYKLAPADRSRISKTPFFIVVGAGFEVWLQFLKPEAGKTWLFLTDGLPLRNTGESGATASFDPHIWHSPELTLAAASKVGQALVQRNAGLGPSVQRCLSDFKVRVGKKLLALKSRVEKIPAPERVLATSHDAFGYFAEALGLSVLPVMGLSTDAAPTPRRLKEVLDGIRAKGVKAIFIETTGSQKTVEAVAREAKIKLGGELFADGLGEKGSGADTVLGLWDTNTNTILAALEPSK